MSKMPAKKKSCFQITSVTQAQVAASSITDDTESLDDPDESRTEDMSSEIFDVSRADLGVCDRSSSEETLNNVGEPQEGQLAPVNGGVSVKRSGLNTPHNLGGSAIVPAAAQPVGPNLAANVSSSVAHTAPATTSFTSRFRVIKLDHGTGEPFRRGRWTCTEFYDRDTEGLNVSRAVDSIKPAVNLDHSTDRDSGLGATVAASSAFSAPAVENAAESGFSHLIHHSEHLQQGYSLAPQIGSGASAFHPTEYTTKQSQQLPQVQVNIPPAASQTFLPSGLNDVHQGAVQQKSPVMPTATQGQQFAYSSHPTGLSSGLLDYRQQHIAALQPQGSSTQNVPLPAGSSTSQGHSPMITPAGPGSNNLGMAAHSGEAATAQGLQLQAGNAPVPGIGLQQPVNQTQPSGGVGIAPATSIITTTSSHSGIHNVPTTVPSTTNTLLGLSSQIPVTGGLVQAQGAHGGTTIGLPSTFGNQIDDSRQKPEVLPQPSTGIVLGKDGMKPLITEGLNLAPPAVNSLFGIAINMDGDEDRNPTTAFYQAFRPSRLRGSKPVNDSASGASVVAIDNKIEQAMDLVKSHLMYAVREEVEVLKEQIKELYERNSVLERENAVLKSLANSEQLSQLSSQLSQASSSSSPQQHPSTTNNNTNITSVHLEGGQSTHQQPNTTSA
ncbi:TSC22 domain family protein 2 [Thalassophryne amazonica]|uniref:TSC22 domain family protein 2 n=1 Tax=Thalassophryne amazonica TaxID=390379 RepID=UPI0014720FB6|nr:TSC22 domain family protein 2 [Thalassophryne amazonica]